MAGAAWLAAVLAHRDAVTEVLPWMYGLAADRQIDTQYPTGQAAAVARDIERLRAAALRLLTAIVALVQRHDYAGVDIDYENLHAGDRQAVSTFVRDLAAALYAHSKLLSVALLAKTSNAGTDPRNVAQDYAAIGRVAGQVRLMGYDYHRATSLPGPIAPVGCAVAVLQRQPRLLLLAVSFPFMRRLDAAISLYSVPAAWLSVSNGRWKSPARRPAGGATTAALPAAGVPASGAFQAGTRDEPGRPARVAEASHVSG